MRRLDQARFLGWAAALSLLAAPLEAETRPIATFGASVEVVNLDVSVTDPKGHHLNDIGTGDLLVFEDGVQQQVCLFTRDHLPISLLILIDGSASMEVNLVTTRGAAIRLVRTLGTGDEVGVAVFNRHFRLVQDFTSDLTAAEEAIAQIEADGETSLYNAIYLSLKDLAALPKDAELRRRAIVVLTDGEDTTSLLRDEDVLELARRAGVAVYTIGLRDARRPEISPVPVFFLTALARETGGRAYFPASLAALEGTYDRIAGELRTLYGLGYVSSNPRQDGGWRRITVRSLLGNLLLRYRPGYYAPRKGRLGGDSR